jgi:pentatricopeptide repeat protein
MMKRTRMHLSIMNRSHVRMYSAASSSSSSSSSIMNTRINRRNTMDKQTLLLFNTFFRNPTEGLRILRSMTNRPQAPYIPELNVLDRLFKHCYTSSSVTELLEIFEMMREYYPTLWNDNKQRLYMLIKALGNANKTNDSYKLFLSFWNSDDPAERPENRTVSCMMNSLDHAGMHSELIILFKQILKSSQYKPTVKDYTMIIRIYTRNKQMEQALFLLDFMKSNGIIPSAITFTVLMKGFYDLQDPHNHRIRSLVSYEPIIDNLRYVVRDKVITILLDDLKKPDFNPLELALRTFKMQADSYEATHDETVRPDVKSYNTLLDALVEQRMISHAESILKTMRSQNLIPSAVTLNIMIKGYLSVKNIEKVEQILNLDKVEVDTFNSIMSYYVKQMKQGEELIQCVNRIIKYYKSMVHHHGIFPSTVTCSLLIEMYHLIGKHHCAELIFNEMERINFEKQQFEDPYQVHLPSTVPRNAMTYILMIIYRPEECKHYFNILLEKHPEIPPTIELMNAMTQQLSQEEALDLWSDIRKRYPSVQPNLKTVALFILKGTTLRQTKTALDLKQNITLPILLKDLINDKTSELIWHNIQSSEEKPDIDLYLAMLEGYSKYGNATEATVVWKQLLHDRQKFLLSSTILDLIMKAWTSSVSVQHFKYALELYRSVAPVANLVQVTKFTQQGKNSNHSMYYLNYQGRPYRVIFTENHKKFMQRQRRHLVDCLRRATWGMQQYNELWNKEKTYQSMMF